jgi:ADP-heptose:LPS heptosyltransferase
MKDNKEEPRKVLLVQKQRIGDVLLTTPAVRALKKSWSPVEIIYMVGSSSSAVMERNPYIDRLLVLPEGSGYGRILSLAAGLRREDLAAAVDLMGHPQTALMVALSGAELKIGFQPPRRRWAYNRPVPRPEEGTFTALQKLELLTPLQVSPDGLDLDFPLRDEEVAFARNYLEGAAPDRPVAAFLPTSRRTYKRWPPEKFAAAADLVQRGAGLTPLFIWGPGEEDSVAEVVSKMKSDFLVAPPTSIGQMTALCRLSRVVVTNDNGPAHLARSQNCRVVTIFLATRPEHWSPGGKLNRDLAEGAGDRKGGPEGTWAIQYLPEITPELVLEAVQDLMGRKKD